MRALIHSSSCRSGSGWPVSSSQTKPPSARRDRRANVSRSVRAACRHDGLPGESVMITTYPRFQGPVRAGRGNLPDASIVPVARGCSHGQLTERATGMIRAQGLTKAFGDKIAVNGLDFTIEPGRVTGFLGPNG